MFRSYVLDTHACVFMLVSPRGSSARHARRCRRGRRRRRNGVGLTGIPVEPRRPHCLADELARPWRCNFSLWIRMSGSTPLPARFCTRLCASATPTSLLVVSLTHTRFSRSSAGLKRRRIRFTATAQRHANDAAVHELRDEFALSYSYRRESLTIASGVLRNPPIAQQSTLCSCTGFGRRA